MHDLLASDNVEKMCLHSVYILFDSIAASHVLEFVVGNLQASFGRLVKRLGRSNFY